MVDYHKLAVDSCSAHVKDYFMYCSVSFRSVYGVHTIYRISSSRSRVSNTSGVSSRSPGVQIICNKYQLSLIDPGDGPVL